MIEIHIIDQTNKSAYDKALHGLSIRREVVDHKGKCYGINYGLPEEFLEKMKTLADTAPMLRGNSKYLKGLIRGFDKMIKRITEGYDE